MMEFLFERNYAIAELLGEQIVRELFEGGPGSGPRPGGVGRRISIDRAQELLGRMGMKMDLKAGSVQTDLTTRRTSYLVTDRHGTQKRMDTKDIIDLVRSKKKLKESFDPVRGVAESIIRNLFEGGPGSGRHSGFGLPKISGKLFGAARKMRNIEVIASGSPTKMLRRLANIVIGRSIVKKLFR